MTSKIFKDLKVGDMVEVTRIGAHLRGVSGMITEINEETGYIAFRPLKPGDIQRVEYWVNHKFQLGKSGMIFEFKRKDKSIAYHYSSLS